MKEFIFIIIFIAFVLGITLALAQMPYTLQYVNHTYFIKEPIPDFSAWKTPCENVAYATDNYKIWYRDYYLYLENKVWNIEVTVFENKKTHAQDLIGFYFAVVKVNKEETDIQIRYWIDKEFVNKGKPSYQLEEVTDLVYQGAETWNHFIYIMNEATK